MEYISCTEAQILVADEHYTRGYWGCNFLKIALSDCIYSPQLDKTIIDVICDYPQCKNFEAIHFHSLL